MKVLVADDDRSWRDIVAGTLQRAGHEVVEAEDGNKALDLFCAAVPGEFGAIVSDLDMGRGSITGEVLLACARELRGESVRCILLTGNNVCPPGVDKVLAKASFDPKVLLAAIGG